MADYTYDELKKMTVAKLRGIAQDVKDESLKAYRTMHKEHLLPALCDALGVHVDHAAHGKGKAKLKAHIHSLRAIRDEAAVAGDKEKVRRVRREIHALKRNLRRMVQTGA